MTFAPLKQLDMITPESIFTLAILLNRHPFHPNPRTEFRDIIPLQRGVDPAALAFFESIIEDPALPGEPCEAVLLPPR